MQKGRYSIIAYFLPFDSSYYEQSQEVNRLFPFVSSVRNLAKCLSKVINKRRRLKSESALHHNSPANVSVMHRLSERRVSDFDDTWIRPYAAGIARANDMKCSAIISYERYDGNYEEKSDYSHDNHENEKDDLEIVFALSSYDHSSDELDEPNYINYEKKMSDVNSVVSAASEDEISLYCDARSRKSSFVRTTITVHFRLLLK